MTRVTKILVPVDFSPCSVGALKYAAYFGKQFGAALEALHVWEPPRYVIPEVTVQLGGQPKQSLMDFARSEASKEMTAFLADVREAQMLEVKSRLESGDPTEVVLGIAANEGFDLIIMGTHGRTGLSHLFLGSVAERVVRRSICPVLIVHRCEEERPSQRDET